MQKKNRSFSSRQSPLRLRGFCPTFGQTDRYHTNVINVSVFVWMCVCLVSLHAQMALPISNKFCMEVAKTLD